MCGFGCFKVTVENECQKRREAIKGLIVRERVKEQYYIGCTFNSVKNNDKV